MAKVIHAELGIKVAPTDLLRLFAKRFDSMSKLAHGIHDNLKPA